jgi:PhnB protein
MQVQPYLFFEGRTEEALEFYKKALGAKIEMFMRNKESPEPPPPGMNAPAEKVMHACFSIGGARVMASDGFCSGKPNFQGFSLSVSAANEGDAKRKFGALAEGGQVKMPLTKTFFSPAFGMVTDRFGLGWMVIVQPPAGKKKPAAKTASTRKKKK